MSTSKITVDLRSRTFSVEVPDQQVDAVLSRIEALFHSDDARGDKGEDAREGQPEAENSGGAAAAAPKSTPLPAAPTRKRSKSGGGKVRAWEAVELGLTTEQRQELRAFYEAKAPRSQNEQVAVLALRLKEFTKKANFSGDEIHSAFKLVNQPTPRNLAAVFGNMKRDGRAGYKDNELVVNSHTEDYVNHHMRKDG